MRRHSQKFITHRCALLCPEPCRRACAHSHSNPVPACAATGQTTGKWFVKFYAPWCGHCKSLAEPWAELATAMKEEHADSGVVIAKLDATAHKKTAQRFAIQGYPSLKFFADGEVRTYSGGRNLAAMKEYVAGIGSSSGEPGYKRDDGEAVPAGPPWWEELVAKVDPHLVEDVQHIIAVRRPARSPCQCQSLAAAAGFPPRAALCAEPELSLSVARQIRKTAAGILFVSGVVVGVVLSQLKGQSGDGEEEEEAPSTRRKTKKAD